jgi:RNA polymerase sigma-70 factor (ECF subfamily)
MLMGNEADAEDVLQEVLIKYMRKGPKPQSSGAKAWLFTVGRNHAFNTMRGLKRRKEHESSGQVSQKAAPAADPGEEVAKKESLQRIRDCLIKLPLLLRELLFLRVVENLSLSQLAQRSGTPKSTTALKVQEGLILLNRCFHGRSYENVGN